MLEHCALKRKLKHIKELDATFAVFNAINVVDLNALIYAISGLIAHHSDEIERRKAQKKAAAAKAAAATVVGGKSKGGKVNIARSPDTQHKNAG